MSGAVMEASKISKSRIRIRRSPMLLHRDDSGNTMIVAVGVLMIVGIIATSVWVKTLGGLEQSVFEQKRVAAFAVANSGLDEALFRLEQWDFDSMPPVGQTVFTGQGSVADGDYSYRVIRTGTRSWSIVATGVNRDEQSTRSIKTDVYTSSRYKHGIYTKDDMTLNGSPGSLCAFTSSTQGNPGTADCPPDDTSLLGTSGEISCQGNGWDEISITIYPPDASASRQCVGDGNVNEAPSPYEFSVTAPPPNAQILPGCTAVSCTISPQMFASLPPGDYRVQNLTIGSGPDQDLCRPPLQLGQSTNIYVTGTLRFARAVYINVGSNNPQRRGCTGPRVGPMIEEGQGNDMFWPTAPPSDFIVTKTCTEGQPVDEIIRDGGGGTAIPAASMVIDALCSRMTMNGGPHFLLFGAALLYEYEVNGALKLLAWDRNLANLKQFLQYRVTNWREIPPVPEP
jgi:hypothetical protein